MNIFYRTKLVHFVLSSVTDCNKMIGGEARSLEIIFAQRGIQYGGKTILKRVTGVIVYEVEWGSQYNKEANHKAAAFTLLA